MTPLKTVLAAVLLAALSHSTSWAGEPGTSAGRVAVAPDDWPWWRGPTRDGVAPAGPTPPLKWSASENVLWKADVPGTGHGSPTVVGDRVFLAASDAGTETQAVVCFDRATGKQLWRTEVHRGGFVKKGHARSSQASATVACDGERVFINFLNGDAVHLTALDLDGKRLWQTKVCDYVPHQGFGASPAIYRSLVLVAVDHKGGGVVAGLDRATGKFVWKRDRPKLPNYTSPIVLTAAGRDQLVMAGCDLVTALDPLTGEELWEVEGATTECVTSTVTDGKRVFTSGGYPKNHMSAVAADGTGKTVWETRTRLYVPSLLVKGDHLFGVTDNGFAACWEAVTGKEVWRERLGGAFSSSPVLVGDRIYAASEAGKTYVFEANPDEFKLLAENELGDGTYSTPAICGGRIYLRVTIRAGMDRREVLYCIGVAK